MTPKKSSAPATAKSSFLAYEIIDGQALRTLIDHLDKVVPREQQIYSLNGNHDVDQKAVLLDMLAHLRKGELPVNYLYSKNSLYHGRQYARGGRSVQSLSRVIRHTLCKDTYRDFDIKNCHPTIALHYCKSKGWEVPFLERYVTDRDTIIREIVDKNSDMSYESVKRVFLSLLNGGSADYKKVQNKTDALNGVYYEIREVFGQMLELPENKYLLDEVTAAEEKKPASKRKNAEAIRRSVCNKVFIDIENNILCCCVDWLKSKGADVRNIVLMFDGFMVPKKVAELMGADWAAEMADYVAAHSDSKIRVQFVEKEMDEAADISVFPTLNVYRDINHNEVGDAELIHFAYNKTDFDMARLVYRLIGYKYRCDGDTMYYFKDHRWVNYGDKVWLSDVSHLNVIFDNVIEKTTMEIQNAIRDENEELQKEQEDLRTKLMASRDAFKSVPAMKRVYELFKSEVYDVKISSLLDSKAGIVGFDNGVLDLTGDAPVFRDGRPDDYVSLSTGYDYRKEWIENPTTDAENFIHSIMHEDAYDAMVTFCATLLTGVNKDHRATFFVGEGGNGKSILCEIMQAVLGGYVSEVSKDLYTKPKKNAGGAEPHVMELKGRLLGLTNETEKTDMFLAAVFKKLSSTDTITTRGMFAKTQTTFTPMYKPVISTNNLPNFTAFDDGVLRRIRIFEFPYKFVENPSKLKPMEKQVDRDLSLKLKTPEVIHQFLSLMMKHYNKKCEDSKSMLKAFDAYKKDLNPLSAWFDETMEITGNASDRMSSSKLYEEYVQWSKDKRVPTMSSTDFGKNMKKIDGIDNKKTGGSIVYTNICKKVIVEADSDIEEVDELDP